MKRLLISLTITIFLTAMLLTDHVSGQQAGKTKGMVAVQSSGREAVEKIIREYLLKNPEIVREAMQALQVKEERERQLLTTANMKKFSSEIYSDAESPVAGNKAGDVSVVVFYDYFCGYCKKTLPALDSLVASDDSVKVIYKEFPIMGPQSLNAAKAVLAANRQGKFAAFHRAMLEAESGSEETIKTAAESLKVDFERLRKDMDDPTIEAAIDRNVRLAESLNINGTPAYLIGDQFIPGAIDADALTRLVAEQRAKQSGGNPRRIGAVSPKLKWRQK